MEDNDKVPDRLAAKSKCSRRSSSDLRRSLLAASDKGKKNAEDHLLANRHEESLNV
jgi:hypothetical protein